MFKMPEGSYTHNAFGWPYHQAQYTIKAHLRNSDNKQINIKLKKKKKKKKKNEANMTWLINDGKIFFMELHNEWLKLLISQ